jgi:hypothetical protein
VRRILYVASRTKTFSDWTFPRAGNDAQQRRLSDSIGLDEPDHAAGRKLDRDRVESDRSTVTLRGAFDARDRALDRSLTDAPLQLWRPGDRRIESQIGNSGQTASHRIGTRAQSLGIDPHPDPETSACLGLHRLGMTYSRSHRLGGIGTCFLITTHARLATLAQQRVELGAAHGDGAAVGQGHRAAGSIHRCDQGAFRG